MKKYTVFEKCSISESMRAIESNHSGCVIVVDGDEKVLGIFTDGDCRRAILSGVSLTTEIKEYYTKEFKYLTKGYSLRELSNLLTLNIRQIPVVDRNLRFIELINNNNLKEKTIINNQTLYARARAPTRIGLAGGGSDITDFFTDSRGNVLSCAIDLYANAILKLRSDNKITLYSKEINEKISFDSYEEFLNNETNHKSQFGLIFSIIKYMSPNFGFDLITYCDYQIGSGLGGSSSLCVSIIAAFDQILGKNWSKNQIAEIAYYIERIQFKDLGGWQDQYAASFGGINFLEFSEKDNVVNNLKIDDRIINEFSDHLILVSTSLTHHSKELQDKLVKNINNNSNNSLQALFKSSEISIEIKNALLHANYSKIGNLMNDAWKIKKSTSSSISNKAIDNLYDLGIKLGAKGGKLLGAGAGGYLLFLVNPWDKIDFINQLNLLSLDSKCIKIDTTGVISWKGQGYDN